MDQVSKRYANPCFIMDGMIQTCRFSEFVDSFLKTVSKEKEEEVNWEFFLHKVWEGSFQSFKEELENNRQNQALSDETIKATINHSMNILNAFEPDDKN